jgi:hypothetical protein
MGRYGAVATHFDFGGAPFIGPDNDDPIGFSRRSPPGRHKGDR